MCHEKRLEYIVITNKIMFNFVILTYSLWILILIVNDKLK